MKTVRLVAGTLALMIAVASVAGAEESKPGFLVVVHAANAVAELPCPVVEKIFLKKLKQWGDESPISPVDQARESPVREHFTEMVHEKSVGTIQRFWQRIIFAGRDLPPPEVAGDSEVMSFVADQPGGVGYVSSGAVVDPRVRVVDGCAAPGDESWEEPAEWQPPPEPQPPPPPPPTPPQRSVAAPPRMVYVSPGSFDMGSPADEPGRGDDETRHRVTVTRGFLVTETEVTQEQWHDFAGGRPAFFDKCGRHCPVERVNWFEALRFANLLSHLAGLETCYELDGCAGEVGAGCAAGQQQCRGDVVCSQVKFRGLGCGGFRLPTEAEWELAARATTTTAFVTGAELPPAARCAADGKAAGPVKVRSFAANPFGLFDVHGNVREWVWDELGSYPIAPVKDPVTALEAGGTAARVTRGGAWSEAVAACRSADRDATDPRTRSAAIGFRLVKTEGRSGS